MRAWDVPGLKLPTVYLSLPPIQLLAIYPVTLEICSMTKKHCLWFPFTLLCTLQEALGKCMGGTVDSVHGSHPARTDSCFNTFKCILPGDVAWCLAFAGLCTQSPALWKQWSNQRDGDVCRRKCSKYLTKHCTSSQSYLQCCYCSFRITWFSFKLM